MKKMVLFIAAVVAVAFAFCRYVMADGTFVYAPGPVIAATGQNYAYPTTASPTAGGQLVNDGVGAFRWSNTSVTSTTSLTILQFPALPSVTKAQIAALQASTTGQYMYCSDCSASGAKGTICVSTGSTASNQFVLSTGTTCL